MVLYNSEVPSVSVRSRSLKRRHGRGYGKYQEKLTQGQHWVFRPWSQSKGPPRSDLNGHGSQPHSEFPPLVLSVLKELRDWSELRRSHTQDQEVAEWERGQENTFWEDYLKACVSSSIRGPRCWLVVAPLSRLHFKTPSLTIQQSINLLL